MRPSEVLSRASDYLARHDVDAPRTTAEILLREVLGTDRVGLYTRTEGLSAVEARTFGRMLCRRCSGVPLQHLTGDQPFRRLTLTVRPGVFVPRPETELLVDIGLAAIGDTDAPLVVDVGTGTGALALSFALEREDARVFGTDLSPEAVELARTNALRSGLSVEIVVGDLLTPLPAEVAGRVDLVVANPPYIAPDEAVDLPPEVRADPDLALFAGPEIYERLAGESAIWLRPGGTLAVEIGATQVAGVSAAFEARLDDVRVERDLTGRDRFVVGRRA